MFAFIQIKSKINKKTKFRYLRSNMGQIFHGSDKMEEKKDRHYQMISCGELLPFVFFLFAF